MTSNGWLSYLLRDFHDELKSLIECQQPGFRACDTDMWRDNIADVAMKESEMAAADSELLKLERNKTAVQFQADSLALARGAAQCANLYQRTLQTERSARLARVMHLKQENSTGAGIVSQIMDTKCKHVAGPMTLLQSALDQVQCVCVCVLLISLEYMVLFQTDGVLANFGKFPSPQSSGTLETLESIQ